MSSSDSHYHQPLALSALLVLLAQCPALQAQEDDASADEAPVTEAREGGPSETAGVDTEAAIFVDAADASIDRADGTLVFTDIEITQGTLGVRARRAIGSGLSFEDSEWTFTEEVKLTSEGSLIEADQAVLTFRDNRLQTAALDGNPVTFRRESSRVAGQLARGRAQRVDYDLANGTVRLKGDAWLCDGGNAITSEAIVYEIDGERVLADGGSAQDGRVQILITPGSNTDESGDCESVAP